MNAPFAVISDIHANLAAFKAVLAVIEAQDVTEIVCLGDVVGYGAEPRECLALAQERCSRILMGNHDAGVLRTPAGFNPHAYQALVWTRRELRSAACRHCPTLLHQTAAAATSSAVH